MNYQNELSSNVSIDKLDLINLSNLFGKRFESPETSDLKDTVMYLFITLNKMSTNSFSSEKWMILGNIAEFIGI